MYGRRLLLRETECDRRNGFGMNEKEQQYLQVKRQSKYTNGSVGVRVRLMVR